MSSSIIGNTVIGTISFYGCTNSQYREVHDLEIKTSSMELEIIECTVPACVSYFTGRKTYLEKIDSEFSKLHSKKSTNNVLVLTGFPGIGKSQLSYYYAHNNWKKDGQSNCDAILLNANEKIHLEQDINALLKYFSLEMQGSTLEKKILALYRKLSTSAEKVLIVIDNAKNKNEIKMILPKSRYDNLFFLITTRDRKDWQLPTVEMRLDDLSMQQDAIQYITENLSLETEEEVLRLASTFQYLALAIVQATKYICNCKKTISEYLNLFEVEDSQALLLQEPNDDYYLKTIAKVWNITSKELKSKLDSSFTALPKKNGLVSCMFKPT